MRHDKTPLLAVAAALLMLQLAACGTKGPQTGNTSLPAGSESTPGKTEEGAVDPEKARAADQAQDAAASPADGKAADPAAGNTADAAATAASPDEGEPVDWDAHEKATAKAEKEAAAAKAELEKLQAEQQTALREAGHQQNADFAEGLVKQGSLKPADKDLIVQVLDFAEYPNDTVLDFGEGKTLADAVKGFLQGLPRILPEGETATAARAAQAQPFAAGSGLAEFAEPEAQSHHERALALAAKENIPYEEAARRTAQ